MIIPVYHQMWKGKAHQCLWSPDDIELLTISPFHLHAMRAEAIETDAAQRIVAVFVVPLLDPIQLGLE